MFNWLDYKLIAIATQLIAKAKMLSSKKLIECWMKILGWWFIAILYMKMA